MKGLMLTQKSEICIESVFPQVEEIESTFEALSGLVVKQAWHLITGSHLCVGSPPTSDNAQDLSWYDPGC